jgi:cob(I)alamin adenosyltransferase
MSNMKGLYPAGEGAGYAGGIMSAAVDGIRIAEAIIKKYKRPDQREKGEGPCKKWVHSGLTGNGKGKTTAALGITLRALCAGNKVFFGQFMKGQDYSEKKACSLLQGLTMEQFGGLCFINGTPDEKDISDAKAGLERMREVLSSGEYDLVVFDEVNTALFFKLLAVEEVMAVLDLKPEKTEVILTGRYAPQEITTGRIFARR